MSCKVSEEDVALMRCVLGSGPSEMDLIRALHLAKNDINLAFNVLFDTIGYKGIETGVKRTTAGSGARVFTTSLQEQVPPTVKNSKASIKQEQTSSSLIFGCDVPLSDHIHEEGSRRVSSLNTNDVKMESMNSLPLDHEEGERKVKKKRKRTGDLNTTSQNDMEEKINDSTQRLDCRMVSCGSKCVDISSKTSIPVMGASHFDDAIESQYDKGFDRQRWILLGETEVLGYSTSKGAKLKAGDILTLSFPKRPDHSHQPSSVWNRGKGAVATQQIVRFGTNRAGDIGRLPGEWAKCLIPLVLDDKVMVEGVCRAAPEVLTTMDSVILTIRLFASTTMFTKEATKVTSLSTSMSDETVHPLPSLFRLLGKEPFKKAEFTPDDLLNKKRSLGSEDTILPVERRRKLSSNENNDVNHQADEDLTDSDINALVGSTESYDLQEMETPSGLLCELRPYQRQALYWMSRLEAGHSDEEASKTLHPCWDAFHLSDKRTTAVYLNVFSGEATMAFPSALKLSRGGILADAMGLGKTVMTIALLLANPGKGGLMIQEAEDKCIQTKRYPIKSRTAYNKGGGTLIICPMTLLGQWKTEIETHSKEGTLSVYCHYGAARTKDPNVLLRHDVVITTYGVLSSDYQSEDSCLCTIRWYRVVLDEAHTIKSSKCQSAQAAFNLSADCRWCLTGTPIQNKLEDAFSLLRFLQIEPWCNWGWWYKLIQKPFDDGDERGLVLLKTILRPLMLRRTKDSTDKDGKPILVLPPAESEVIICEFSDAERDFYDALYKKSKIKFDQFVEQGKVLHNYASILELLLRMRQCCDHPYLVLSRSDTDAFADLEKLARRFLDGGPNNRSAVSEAYIHEVVEDLRKGNKAECPICLEVAEDAVLTPCAHCMCRECLLGSWSSASGGACPICRQHMTRHDILTAPSESRFRLDVEKSWIESSKVTALMQELEILKQAGAKSIVFSQWTSFLDLLQIPLNRRDIMYVRLDGTLNQVQREKVIREFSSNPKILVMLISLKAGGVGINLTAASHAFLLDPWWNPAVEEQAIMRIHRIGQTKKVSIKRFITKDSVEERMQQVQARKQRMIAGALTDEEIRSARIEELKLLFR